MGGKLANRVKYPPLIVAKSLFDPGQPFIPIRVANLSLAPVFLYKNTAVATGEPMFDMGEPVVYCRENVDVQDDTDHDTDLGVGTNECFRTSEGWHSALSRVRGPALPYASSTESQPDIRPGPNSLDKGSMGVEAVVADLAADSRRSDSRTCPTTVTENVSQCFKGSLIYPSSAQETCSNQAQSWQEGDNAVCTSQGQYRECTMNEDPDYMKPILDNSRTHLTDGTENRLSSFC
ncbi:unnamed protein product [Owenia fusiformis]|uniref:Uncharacterized protein n=1 Tax=Owenia fusiformis TaxID=6347 RepID=A0A8J1UHQ0_OWEFU|nr:unnamed protein product [Owenia fusiformis]